MTDDATRNKSKFIIHFRKIRSKGNLFDECRTQIEKLALNFGEIDSLKLLYGRGQAILKMKEQGSINEILGYFEKDLHKIDPDFHLLKNAIVIYGDNKEKIDYNIRNLDPAIISIETHRCLNKLISDLIKRNSEERRDEKKNMLKRKEQLFTCSSVKKNKQICYEYSLRGGVCSRAENCHAMHRLISITDIPRKYRLHETVNLFPLSKEISSQKDDINLRLVELGTQIKNKRCLVLDGSSSNTAKTLRSCQKMKRAADDIIVPNFCYETFEKIKALGILIIYQIIKINIRDIDSLIFPLLLIILIIRLWQCILR